jgi:16S rRNA (cytosine967-C5)-methyltransferase
VSHWLDPQPREVIIDACAAPGGKTTHIAELMGDEGIIWASDRSSNRLKKVKENQERLQLKSIRIVAQDSRDNPPEGAADRVLLDAPCSGLGTLHKRPDIRWRQNPHKIGELVLLQQQLLTNCASWVKPKGILVYSTCTLNMRENEEVVGNFLATHPGWEIIAPAPETAIARFATPGGWLKVLPHRHHLDGFFLVKLRKGL